MTKEPRYLAYLLRLWQVDDRGEMIWRASVEVPGTGERRGFASLGDLFEFLETQAELGDDQVDYGGWNRKEDDHARQKT